MIDSLAETIAHVARKMPPALVRPDAIAAIQRAAAALPASLTGWIDFECRLMDDASPVDFSFRVGPRERDRLAQFSLARSAEAFALRGPVERSGAPAWRRVAAMARAWSDRAWPLAGDVAGLWLEFDLDGDATPLPRLFIDLARGGVAGGDRVAIAPAILEAALGQSIPQWLREAFTGLGRVLPADLELRYIGLPASDDVAGVRLCWLAANEMPAIDALRAAGWTGELSAVRRLAERRREIRGSAPSHGVMLHVDVMRDSGSRGSLSSIASRVGIEFPFRRRPQVKGIVADTPFLDALVECGLCSAVRRDALVAWPGCEVATLPHAIWPELVLRRISHVKIVFDAGRPPEAKAYLCAAHAWRPDLLHGIVGDVRRPPLSTSAPIAS